MSLSLPEDVDDEEEDANATQDDGEARHYQDDPREEHHEEAEAANSQPREAAREARDLQQRHMVPDHALAELSQPILSLHGGVVLFKRRRHSLSHFSRTLF